MQDTCQYSQLPWCNRLYGPSLSLVCVSLSPVTTSKKRCIGRGDRKTLDFSVCLPVKMVTFEVTVLSVSFIQKPDTQSQKPTVPRSFTHSVPGSPIHDLISQLSFIWTLNFPYQNFNVSAIAFYDILAWELVPHTPAISGGWGGGGRPVPYSMPNSLPCASALFSATFTVLWLQATETAVLELKCVCVHTHKGIPWKDIEYLKELSGRA